MAAILDYLAERPGQEVTTEELSGAIGRTRSQIAGVAGAFGHRLKSRYGIDTWPFEAYWSRRHGMVVYRMSEQVAVPLRTLA